MGQVGRPVKGARRPATKRTKADNIVASQAGKAGRPNRLSMVRGLIDTWSKKLAEDATKSGIAELARLLALEKEMSASKETIREVKVTWVEPATTESAKSE